MGLYIVSHLAEPRNTGLFYVNQCLYIISSTFRYRNCSPLMSRI